MSQSKMSLSSLRMCLDKCTFHGSCWKSGVDYVCRCVKDYTGVACADKILSTTSTVATVGFSGWAIFGIVLVSFVVLGLVFLFCFYRYKKYSDDYRNCGELDKKGLVAKLARVWEV